MVMKYGKGWEENLRPDRDRVAEAIGRHVLAGRALFADDTPVSAAGAGDRQDGDGADVDLCSGRSPWAGESPPAA